MDALEALLTRRSIGRLTEPAPSEQELRTMLAAATAAPDHGRLRPWRFIVLRGAGLRALADAFAQAQTVREPEAAGATSGLVAATRAKLGRAPVVVAVIASPQPSAKVPAWEQQASAAAAAQNLCLAAHALGYGAMWRTGWHGEAREVREHLGIAEEELLIAWVYVGSVPPDAAPPAARPPVELESVVEWRT